MAGPRKYDKPKGAGRKPEDGKPRRSGDGPKTRGGGKSFDNKKGSSGRYPKTDRKYSAKPDGEGKSFDDKKEASDKYPKTDKKYGDKPDRRGRSYDDKKGSSGRYPKTDRKYGGKPEGEGKSFDDKKETSNEYPKTDKKYGDKPDRRGRSSDDKRGSSERYPKTDRKYGSKPGFKKRFKPREKEEKESDGLTRLNKFIANAGICSRREADTLIKQGLITVNDKVVTEMGFKLQPADTVKYAGQTLRGEALRYVLLNKPKDYITTSKDPQNRKTVMHLVAKATKERIYPVGRLDRNTTGVLLFTNDGDLAKKLSHPKHGYKKIYHVQLDKNIKVSDMEKLAKGVELEDGLAIADSIAYVSGASKKEVGIEIHSGKNRVVRRMFDHLGYLVVKLDRVYFAGLTKKDVPRGAWRHLNEKEVNMLKMSIK